MKRCYLIPALSLVLTSCMVVGPDYHEPKVATPKQWSVTSTETNKTLSDKWWLSFHDPLLNQLMQEAIAANLDLKLARQRVLDARYLRTETIAAGLPTLGAKANISKRLNNTQASGGNTSGGGFGVGNQLINIFQQGFDAVWELDLFGGEQRAVEAADANVDLEIENTRDVLVSLLAEVARNYIELRANQQLVISTLANSQTQQDTLNLIEIRRQAGLTSSLELSQQQAQLAITLAQLPVYETGVKQAIYALSLLLAKQPEALVALLSPPGKLISGKEVITELPSKLLQRRPDIRRAEREMAKANAYVGIATSELYPKVNLAAFLGLQNISIKDFTPIGKSWSTAAAMTMPLFNWGKLNANIKSKKSQYEQSFLNYQTVVLTAFKEVEDALVAHRNEQLRQNALAQAVAANELAVALANERYNKGLTGFLDVLEGQRSLYISQNSLIESSAKLSGNLVALYKALGGGWQTEPSVNDSCYRFADKNRFEQLRAFIKDDCQ